MIALEYDAAKHRGFAALPHSRRCGYRHRSRASWCCCQPTTSMLDSTTIWQFLVPFPDPTNPFIQRPVVDLDLVTAPVWVGPAALEPFLNVTDADRPTYISLNLGR